MATICTTVCSKSKEEHRDSHCHRTVCWPSKWQAVIGWRPDTSRHVLGGVLFFSLEKFDPIWLWECVEFSRFSFWTSFGPPLKNSGWSRIPERCLFFCLNLPDLDIDIVWRNRAFFSFSDSGCHPDSSLNDSDLIKSDLAFPSFFDDFFPQNLSQDIFSSKMFSFFVLVD